MAMTTTTAFQNEWCIYVELRLTPPKAVVIRHFVAVATSSDPVTAPAARRVLTRFPSTRLGAGRAAPSSRTANYHSLAIFSESCSSYAKLGEGVGKPGCDEMIKVATGVGLQVDSCRVFTNSRGQALTVATPVPQPQLARCRHEGGRFEASSRCQRSGPGG